MAAELLAAAIIRQFSISITMETTERIKEKWEEMAKQSHKRM